MTATRTLNDPRSHTYRRVLARAHVYLPENLRHVRRRATGRYWSSGLWRSEKALEGTDGNHPRKTHAPTGHAAHLCAANQVEVLDVLEEESARCTSLLGKAGSAV